MARRFSTPGLTSVALALLLALGACGGGSDGASRPGSSGADPELREVAEVMQKTILEGALSGAVLGGAITLGSDKDTRTSAIALGATAGAAAGSYVALIQRQYILRGRRLNRMREDIDTNSQEVAATISVMRRVLAEQQGELAEVRAEVETGGADDRDVSREVAQARANLNEMDRAIRGASNRQAEFAEARRLVSTSGGGSEIDPELASLSAQIAEMRAIATDLSQDL